LRPHEAIKKARTSLDPGAVVEGLLQLVGQLAALAGLQRRIQHRLNQFSAATQSGHLRLIPVVRPIHVHYPNPRQLQRPALQSCPLLVDQLGPHVRDLDDELRG
jgi:hypothetical protein